MNSDVVIIGAGLSGLLDALLLAESGRKVMVVERHKVPGGYLQQFRRKGTLFDVGFHYMGSTLPGRPMRKFLDHLHVWDRLRLVPFPEEAAIEVVSRGRRFGYPTRFDHFREKALLAWPHEREAIERFVGDVRDLCSRFRWFDLRPDVSYGSPRDLGLFQGSLKDYLSPIVKDPWLYEVLCFQTFNLGLFPHEAPWVKHALAFRSNFDDTSRIDGGGGALVDALVWRGEELGVEYRFSSEITAFDCDQRRVRRAVSSTGEAFHADTFVAACNPKQIARCIPDSNLPSLFKERLWSMKDSRGAFQVFLRLREPLRSIGATCLLLHDETEAAMELPIHTILVTHPGSSENVPRGRPRLEAMAYMDYAPFAGWADKPVNRRGPDYERLKAELARRIIAVITREAPELPELILDVYTATPLTDEWYTKNEHGGVFGISHDISQQGTERPQPRMLLKNLFFTGHSVMMPGICGVFINAFDTCSSIRGDDSLFRAVAG